MNRKSLKVAATFAALLLGSSSLGWANQPGMRGPSGYRAAPAGPAAFNGARAGISTGAFVGAIATGVILGLASQPQAAPPVQYQQYSPYGGYAPQATTPVPQSGAPVFSATGGVDADGRPTWWRYNPDGTVILVHSNGTPFVKGGLWAGFCASMEHWYYRQCR